MNWLIVAALLLTAVLPAGALVLREQDVADDPVVVATTYGVFSRYGNVCNPLNTD